MVLTGKMVSLRSVGLVLVFLFSVFHYSLPYFINVDAHAEECFFDRVQNGTKLGKLGRNIV